MARFSHTVTANRSTKRAWEVLQDASVWGTLLGASEVSHVEHAKGHRLKSCNWKAKIGGRELVGSMTVVKSTYRELMVVDVSAEEWSGTVEMEMLAESQRRTRLHTRSRVSANGFTALLALPVVSKVIGKHLPERMEALADIIEE